MSADTDVYVKVIVGKEKWVRVYAPSKGEAAEQANKMPGVIYVMDVQYDEPPDFIEHG